MLAFALQATQLLGSMSFRALSPLAGAVIQMLPVGRLLLLAPMHGVQRLEAFSILQPAQNQLVGCPGHQHLPGLLLLQGSRTRASGTCALRSMRIGADAGHPGCDQRV